MKLIALLGATVLLSTTTVTAQLYNSFINCIVAGSVPTGRINTAGAASSEDCVTQCLSTNFRYAYYTTSSTLAGTTAGESACSCSNTQPPITGFTRTVDTIGDITCNDPADFQAYLLRTTNRFDGCSRGGGDKAPYEVADGTVNTFEGCLTYCVNYNTIYFQARPSSNNVFCVCETDAAPTATRCGRGDEDNGSGNYYTMYRRTPGAVASGGLRKRSKGIHCDTVQPGNACDTSFYHADLPERHLQAQEYCPTGTTACNIPDQPGSYECLDTTIELESCGGCLHGEFGKANSTIGVDCYTQFPKSVQNRVTCSSSKCLLY